MSRQYRVFFGMKREPFASDLRIEEILETGDTQAVRERLHYTVGLGAVAVVTGEVGAGKSTALRLAVTDLHPSEYKPLCVTATPGSISELYKQVVWELGLETISGSRVRLIRMIREAVQEDQRPAAAQRLVMHQPALNDDCAHSSLNPIRTIN